MRKHGLTATLLALFALSLAGHLYFGFKSFNEDRVRDNLPTLESVAEYSRSGHFISSVSENMESEFLQMALFVFLTMCLYQVGSAESRKPPEQETAGDRAKDRREERYDRIHLQQHPLLWRLYRNSLALALLALFAVSFVLHTYGSWMMINDERAHQGLTAIVFWTTFTESDFWFQSFQNWQSEFFSIAVVGVLSIFLRQKNSPQSKKLFEANVKTGGS